MQRLIPKRPYPVWLARMALALLVCGAALPPPGHAQPARGPDAQVAAAASQQDWPRVLQLLQAEAPPPAHRLVQGHTALAQNQNNTALCLFQSASAAEDLHAWDHWTQALVQQHPDQVIAHYFRGDALARLAQWDAALRAFDPALARHPTHALVRNARGVVYAAQGRRDEARDEFEQAIHADPAFADAYANRGALSVQRRIGAEQARKAFTQALTLAPGFALAKAGEGYMQFVRGHLAAGYHALDEAAKQTPCLHELLAVNLANIAAWLNTREEVDLAAVPSEPPGTTIGRLLNRVERGDLRAVTALARLVGKHSEYATIVGDGLTAIGQKDPQLGSRIDQKLKAGEAWTSKTGGAMGLLTLLKGLTLGWSQERGQDMRLGPLQAASQTEGKGRLNLRGFAEHLIGITRQDNKSWEMLRTQYKGPGDTTGGVSTIVNWVDRGDWPFVVSYGLLYPVPSP